MSQISETIDVNVPCRVAYDQWTQFEQFPRFMDGVDRVVQIDDRTLDWTATLAGQVTRWRAKITRQQPDQIIAWRSIEGVRNDGSVRFVSLGPDLTRIELTMHAEPEGAAETMGDALGLVARQVRADLERFKSFIEAHGEPTGAWRGTVSSGRS